MFHRSIHLSILQVLPSLVLVWAVPSQQRPSFPYCLAARFVCTFSFSEWTSYFYAVAVFIYFFNPVLESHLHNYSVCGLSPLSCMHRIQIENIASGHDFCIRCRFTGTQAHPSHSPSVFIFRRGECEGRGESLGTRLAGVHRKLLMLKICRRDGDLFGSAINFADSYYCRMRSLCSGG